MSTTISHLAVLERFQGVDLEELDRTASLQTRFDRKYLISERTGIELLNDLSSEVAVLRIAGSAVFRYSTVYYDTPELDSFMSTAHRRRHRFKVRIRSYLDSGLTVLEVKRRGRRGETIKVRFDDQPLTGDNLSRHAMAFVDEILDRPRLSERLRPTLQTLFDRTTLLDYSDGSRSTLDRKITLATPDGATVVLSDHSILETKSVGAATEADRWMWARGQRPVSFSKFCIGMALNYPSLPANKWNRVLRHEFGWKPQRDRCVDWPVVRAATADGDTCRTRRWFTDDSQVGG